MVKVGYSDIFEMTMKAHEQGHDMIIHKGGTASAKTWDLMTFCLLYLPSVIPKNETNPTITILSESMPHLKRGCMRYAKSILNKAQISDKVPFNKTDSFFDFGNCVVEFISADRLGAAIGNRRFALYANEINNINPEIYEEMARRTKYNFCDFNPTMQFWLEEKILPFYPKHIIYKSNYTNNLYLPDHEKERIKLRAEQDPNFKRIHIDCEYGNADDLVFMPEKILLIDEFPKDLKHSYGLDFGFVAPSAMTKVGITETDVYIHQQFYRAGMNERDFDSELSQIDRGDKITGDSEDQRMINYIFSQGFNIFSAKKAAGSVAFGVSFLQGKRINITKDSTETIKEFRNLLHAKDRTGKPTGKYTGDDHAIDSVRYALEDLTGHNVAMGGMSF